MQRWGRLCRALRLRGWIAAAAALCGALAPVAFAGPPFQTDDPDPVAFRHFEMYAFELSDSTTTGGTALEAPAYEVNWGAVPNVQIHLVVPLVSAFPPASQKVPTYFGVGDTELGVKLRLVKETKRRPEVGIFPFVELPSGNATKGLGVGSTWYRMPLWVQKSWGPWTSYGGGGEVVVRQTGYKDYPFAGWLVQRQLNKKLMMGMELFGHGAIGDAVGSTRYATMADLGGSYEFKEGFDLLFAAGRTVAGQPETYTYAALYWTWGKDSGADADAPQSGLMSMLQRVHLR